ncbi:MAG TPA: hypothetical protein VLX59_10275, partial [Acidimicrobiales bacterium]|nr:hypothetical protein [Acidimicrobiales bacterium]
GPSPGLENAAATALNLADPATGRPAAVVTNGNNGANNATLATLNTLANLASLCAGTTPHRCDQVMRLSTAPTGAVPGNTAAALVNLARNRTLAPAELYALARMSTTYQPSLAAPPTAWILAILYTDTDLFASGRIALGSHGNVWSNNNWLPGTKNPSLCMTVLNPVGQPTLGSPISGGRHEWRRLGYSHRPERVSVGGQFRWQRHIAILTDRRSSLAQRGMDSRIPQPPPGHRRRPEGQRVDR